MGKNSKLDQNSPDFDYEEWRKSEGIKPSLEITISVTNPEDEEEEEEDDAESEPDEYKKFKKDNSVKSVKDVLNNVKRPI